MTISVDLGEKLEGFVTELVENGRYGSKSEILREGVRLVQERERALEELDRKLAEGLADIEAGRAKPLEEVAARLKSKYRAMGRAAE